MPRPFDPIAILHVLHDHEVEFVVIGGTGARLHGVPYVTEDVDVLPARDHDNLERLAGALRALDARLRLPGDDDDGVPFPIEARFLAANTSWTLRTAHGDLDLVFEPAAMAPYEEIAPEAARMRIVEDPPVVVLVAPLPSIIRSKQAANRPKDKAALHLLQLTQTEIERRQRRGR